MLTVDYDRLGLRAGDTLLDLGCGFGRHTYEALVRGAHVVQCDMAMPELANIRDTSKLLVEDGMFGGDLLVAPVQGDATRLPFDDESFERIIASEVFEHIPDDVAAYSELMRLLRPGGTVAVTIPAWLPEQICWKLSDDYHAPAVEGGHVRIYTKKEVRSKMAEAGLIPGGSHHAHSLHAPYWWLRCVVGPNREINDNRLVKTYHKFLEWDIVKKPFITKAADKILNPVIGKSLVVYATKPVLSEVGDSHAA